MYMSYWRFFYCNCLFYNRALVERKHTCRLSFPSLSLIRRGFVDLRTEWKRCDWLIPLSWQKNHNKLDWFFLLRLYTFVIVLNKIVTIRVHNELTSQVNYNVILHLEFVVWYLSQVKEIIFYSELHSIKW